MPIWISTAIGLVVGTSLIVVSIWWAFRPRPVGSKSILPEAMQNESQPSHDVLNAAGNDHP